MKYFRLCMTVSSIELNTFNPVSVIMIKFQGQNGIRSWLVCGGGWVWVDKFIIQFSSISICLLHIIYGPDHESVFSALAKYFMLALSQLFFM